MIYPNGERVNYSYLPQGALDMLGQYVVGSQYDEAGRLELRYLGNAVQVDYEYYDWDEQGGRLSTLKSGFPNIPTGVQNLEYNYDLNGNVTTILDTTNGTAQTLSFGYDLLDRLTSATAVGGQGTYNQSYSYDGTTGNLASKAGVNYTYASPSHKHAVTSTSNGKSYSYDANGNMTSHAGDVLTYNGENHLVQASIGGVNTTYGYDGDGQQVLVKNGTEKTIYIGTHFEVRISPSIQPPAAQQPPANPCLSGSVTCFYLPITPNGVTVADPPAQREWRSYYYAETSRIAVRVQGGVLPAGGKTSYLLGDHLGSTSVTLGEAGEKIGEIRYYPWGETRWESGTAQTAYRYTGQRLEGIGLYWFGSRFYDPALGRWTQADTVVPKTSQGTQAWDRYAYGFGNPIKYIDPDGHTPIEGDDYPPPEDNNPPSKITIDDENGVCIKAGNIGCSGTIQSNLEWIILNAGYVSDPQFWNNLSLFLTDAALASSTVGATAEIIGAVLGLEGGPLGIVVGAIGGNQFHLVVTNPIETGLSSVATFTTVFIADPLAGNTSISYQDNSTTFTIGEASATSMVAQFAGFVTPIGVADALIDKYASAYSHGTAPGVFSSVNLFGASINLGPLTIILGK